MPMPINRFPGAAPAFSNGLIVRERPELALQAMNVVTLYAFVEAQIGELMIKILQAEARPAIEMLIAQKNSSRQREQILQIATEKLTQERVEELGVLVGLLVSQQKRRNKLVHWYSGISFQIPDAIVFINPYVLFRHRVDTQDMVCDIVRAAGGTITSKTRFPLRSTRDELINVIKGGKKEGAPVAAFADLIIDTIQPYPGGKNAAIYDLHMLDIHDKHLLIVPVFSVAKLAGVSWVDEGGNSFTGATLGVSGNKILQPMKSAHRTKITNYGKPGFHIRFDKGQPFEDQPVIPTLVQLSQLVSGVVSAFEETY